jgi:hypothetical protein
MACRKPRSMFLQAGYASTSTLNASRRPSPRSRASVNHSRVTPSTTSNVSTSPSQTGLSPTSRINLLRDFVGLSFLGGVEEVGLDAGDDRVGEVLPAERVERAHGVGARREVVECVQLAGALDVVRCVDHDLSDEGRAECGEHVLRCRARHRDQDDLGPRDRVGDSCLSRPGGVADAVDDLVASGLPLAAEGAPDVAGPVTLDSALGEEDFCYLTTVGRVTPSRTRSRSGSRGKARPSTCSPGPRPLRSICISSAPFRTSTQPTRSWPRPATSAVLWILECPSRQGRGGDRRAGRGCLRSHARRALAENLTPDEVRQVGLLALTTIGFPHTLAGLGWIDEVIASKD